MFIQLPGPCGEDQSYLWITTSRWTSVLQHGALSAIRLEGYSRCSLFLLIARKGCNLKQENSKTDGLWFPEPHLQDHDRNQESIHVSLWDKIWHF